MENPESVDRIVSPLSLTGRVLIEIVKNCAMSVPAIRTARSRLGRTVIAEERHQELDRYVFRLFDLVQKFSGGVAGKSILEIGPGDNLVSGLAFLAAGASSYTAIDRFPGAYTSAAARALYSKLAQNWPYGAWPEGLDPARFPDYPNVFTKAVSVEDVGTLGTYDVVCSYHVGEHISDIRSFAELSRAALAVNGVAVHEIDFGGHQWNRFGDPFLFLKFPEWIWSAMGSARGEPNRVRFKEYLQYFEKAGLAVDVPARRQCAPDPADSWVQNRADDSFLTTDATFVVRRSAH